VLPEQAVDGARCDSGGQDAVCSAAALASSP
jgi:hypothetical protein